MADNVPVTPGVGANIATDDVGGAHFQRVKIDIGADGVSSPVTVDNPVPNVIKSPVQSYAPGYGPNAGGVSPPTIDDMGYTQIRGPVMTDEGGYRHNFAGSSLAVSIGTCTFTNGSVTVTGTGFENADLQLGCYVYLTADGITAMKQIDSFTDTEITLTEPYTGAGGTGASSRQTEKSVVGAGGTLTVSSGQCTIAAGTTAASVFELERDVDILPLTKEGKFSISQRIANQDIYFGFYDENSGAAPRWYFWFHFTGTTNTAVNCVCGWNPTSAPTGGEISTQTVTLPAGVTTAASNTYRVETLKDRVFFYINETLIASERRVVPHPHDTLTSTLRIVNGTTPASNTNVVVDYINCANFNVVSTENPSQNMTITNPNVPAAEVLNYNVAGVIAINTVLGTFDVSQFRALTIQCISMGTTGVVTIESSIDAGTTWIASGIWSINGSALGTTFASAGIWVAAGVGALLRLRMSTATTGGTTTIRVRGLHQVPFLLTNNTTVSGTITASNTTGNVAHDAAVSGNPVRIGARALTSNYTAVATGDVADLITTLVGALVQKPYAIPELDWAGITQISNSATANQIKAAVASNQNYLTGFTLQHATLGGSADFCIRTTPVASTTATISSNTLVMAATYNWKVGDLVYVTASTVTGLTAGNYYYLLTVSGANLTFSATRGGSTLAISGTSVSATLTKILHRSTLQTTALPLSPVHLATPISGGTNLALEAVTVAAVTGVIDVNPRGYVAP